MIISADIEMTLIILTIIQIKTKSLSKQHEKETSSIWKTVSIKKKIYNYHCGRQDTAH